MAFLITIFVSPAKFLLGSSVFFCVYQSVTSSFLQKQKNWISCKTSKKRFILSCWMNYILQIFKKKNHFCANNVNRSLHIIYSYNHMQKVFWGGKINKSSKVRQNRKLWYLFLHIFWALVPKMYFCIWGWIQDCVSMQFWDFPKIP